MKLLTKKQFNEALYDYYTLHYGEKDTDKWYEQPAVDVWVFERDNKIMTLKRHILTGKVTEQVEG